MVKLEDKEEVKKQGECKKEVGKAEDMASDLEEVKEEVGLDLEELKQIALMIWQEIEAWLLEEVKEGVVDHLLEEEEEEDLQCLVEEDLCQRQKDLHHL